MVRILSASQSQADYSLFFCSYWLLSAFSLTTYSYLGLFPLNDLIYLLNLTHHEWAQMWCNHIHMLPVSHLHSCFLARSFINLLFKICGHLKVCLLTRWNHMFIEWYCDTCILVLTCFAKSSCFYMILFYVSGGMPTETTEPDRYYIW